MHERAERARNVFGLKAKLLNKQRRAEKIQMKKTYGALAGRRTSGGPSGAARART